MGAFGGLANVEQAKLLREVRERLERDYVAKRHKVVRRLAFETHSDLGGILLELVQNAEDARATELIICIKPGGLRVENDGQSFSEEDLYSLCSLFASEKGLRSWGSFGVGFKSVLQLTETPYLISGPFFCKLEKGVDPHPASQAELSFDPSPERTTFWLPWREGVSPDNVEERFLAKFQESDVGMLLFLDHLQKVELRGIKNSAFCRMEHEILREEAGVKVIRIATVGDQFSEWLRFDMFAYLPEEVAVYFVEKHAFDEEERGRFSADTLKVSLAIKIEEGSPVETDGLVFAGLPTKEKTGFKFHVCARFPTNLSRERLKDIQEDPLGRWLLERLVELAGRLPFELKDTGWFKPSMWLVFPAEGEAKETFKGIEEVLLAALREGSYVHDSSGSPRPPAEALLAHRSELYEVLTSSDLEQLSGLPRVDWVHPDLRAGHARKVLKSVGVREVSAEDMLSWLEQNSCERGWVKSRPAEWFLKLYRYLNTLRDSKLWDRIRDLPIVLTRQGRLVKAAEALFPPEDEDSLTPELGSYMKELDGIVVADELASGEAREFLASLRVREFDWGLVVERLFEREYAEEKPAPEANRRHVSLLRGLWEGQKIAGEKLEAIGERYSMLRDRTGRYVRPAEAYLPQEYVSAPNEKRALESLEQFFKFAGGRPFISPDYLHPGESAAKKASRGSLAGEDSAKVAEGWRKFLLELGVRDCPRLQKFELQGKGWWEIEEEAEQRGFSCPRYTRGYLILVDWDVDGLAQVMEHLSRHPRLDDVKVVWFAMAWFYHCLGEEEVVKHYGNGITSRWPLLQEVRYAELSYFYQRRKWERKDATWVRILRSWRWLLDEDERPALPDELFAHDLKEVLGPGFAFLHPELPLEGWHRKLGEELLKIKSKAELEDVLGNLRAMRERGDAGEEQVLPIYEYLSGRREYREEIRDLFLLEPLIFIPGQGWFRTGDVCWRDEVGILPALEPCWGERLRSFFCRDLGVTEEPKSEQYAQALISLSLSRNFPPLEQVDELYRNIWEAHRRGKLNEEMWRELRASPCWLGRRSEGQLCWSEAAGLFLNDDKEVAKLFEGKVTWWALSGLEELAKSLEVEPISRARPVVTQRVVVLREEKELAGKLGEVWRYLFLLLRGEKEVLEDPPKVLRVAGIEVRYVAKSVVSRSLKLASWYQREENKLLVTGTSPLGMEEEVAEALRLALRIEAISELVKDLFRSVDDPGRLESILEKWCRRFGMEYHELAEELAAARVGLCGRVPEPEVPVAGGAIVAPGTGGTRPEKESEEVPVSMEEVVPSAQGGQGESEEFWIAPDQAGESTLAPRAKRALPRPAEYGVGGLEGLRPRHREVSGEYWESEGERDQRKEPIEFTGRRLTRTEELAEVERVAVDTARKWLESRGYRVYEEAAYDVGHDLRCVRRDGSEFWVEVKGRSGPFVVSLTEKQWNQALEKGEDYWLVIVEVGEGTTGRGSRIFLIKSPTEFDFERKEVTTVQYDAQADQWIGWAEEVSLDDE